MCVLDLFIFLPKQNVELFTISPSYRYGTEFCKVLIGIESLIKPPNNNLNHRHLVPIHFPLNFTECEKYEFEVLRNYVGKCIFSAYYIFMVKNRKVIWHIAFFTKSKIDLRVFNLSNKKSYSCFKK